jgi:hypothetical protein
MTGDVAHTAAAALWDDNPAVEDLLGFDAVVAPILTALRDPNLDPITIGVHAPWGGGKSSLLNLIEAAAGNDWIVVRTSPWEYEDQLDVKGTLIAEVLTKLQERMDSEVAEGPLKVQLSDRFKKLYRRISWSRVGLAVAKGALTMNWDPEALVQAFSPKQDDTPQSLAAFRKEFAELVGELPITRVVVLVDDLDRCLPEAVVATLESIKLFLSVKRMAFVIAADQKMVESAIMASLAGTGRSEEFAQRYLEKIVQLPIGMPRLSPVESEAYIGLLLARAEMTAESMTVLIAHCSSRRLANQAPLLGDLEGLEVRPSEATLTLAAQLNSGLEPDKRGNPREIKRRLNAFGVRSQIAAARGLTISPAVVMKLLLLEADYDLAFKKLAGQPDGERSRFLSEWEDWARGARDNPPEGIDETTRDWARSEPRLGAEELDGPERRASWACSEASQRRGHGATRGSGGHRWQNRRGVEKDRLGSVRRSPALRRNECRLHRPGIGRHCEGSAGRD